MLKRRVRRIVSILFLAIVIAALGTLYALGSALIAPNRSFVGELPPDLGGESVLIPSESGSALHAWFVPGRRDAVVLMHGLHGSRRSELARARLMHDAGYSVLMFDFQAHGESPGSAVTFGYLESRDASAAVGYVRSRLPGQKITVVAQSMGGAAAILARPTLPIDALVVEAVYPDLDDAVADRLAMRLGSWSRALSPGLTLQVQPRLGFPTSALRPIDRVAHLPMPKLFIAGSADEHTRLEESRALFAAAAEPKALWVIEGAAHVDFYSFAPEEYRQRVLGFLRESIDR